MTAPTAEGPSAASTTSRGAWLALIAALLGWMFDGAEMGVFSLVGRPALKELLTAEMPGAAAAEIEAATGNWLGVITAMFLVGAATGGVLFGWLGDRIGRVRAMTLSVLTYAVFTGLCGFAGSVFQVGLMRFIASLGMGGEWSLGVALVMEVWPNRSRAFMAGLIGAAANVGYLMVGFVGLGLALVIDRLKGLLLAIGFSEGLTTQLTSSQGWRIMMILGIAPALLTFLIRMFVPESRKWEEQKEKGNTLNWATRDLLGVLFGCLGPALMVYLYGWKQTGSIEHTTGMKVVAIVLGLIVALLGYTYPIVRYLKRYTASNPVDGPELYRSTLRRMLLGAGLSGVALLGTWGATQQAPAWVDRMVEAGNKQAEEQAAAQRAAGEPVTATKIAAKEWLLIWLSVGAIVGTIMAALMGDWFGRRKTYFALCVLSLISVLYLFWANESYGNGLLASAFVAGVFSASFYGWLPLYLPELFRTSVRATGQGFGFNFGRILAAIGSFQLGPLRAAFQDGISLGPVQIAGGYPSACTLLSLIYVAGMILIWFAPETKGQPLPE